MDIDFLRQQRAHRTSPSKCTVFFGSATLSTESDSSQALVLKEEIKPMHKTSLSATNHTLNHAVKMQDVFEMGEIFQ